jgi:hypothetical protein
VYFYHGFSSEFESFLAAESTGALSDAGFPSQAVSLYGAAPEPQERGVIAARIALKPFLLF